MKIGPSDEYKGDPLVHIEEELSKNKYIHLKELPVFTGIFNSKIFVLGGSVGYVSFECIKYFEPHCDQQLEDDLNIPECIQMLCDTLIVFDHLYQKVIIITHIIADLDNLNPDELKKRHEEADQRLSGLYKILNFNEMSLPNQGPIKLGNKFTTKIGESEYKEYVNKLKEHIQQGDIIQAVPSRRLKRPTDLHPFNCYRYLRTLNPSPYLFYLSMDGIDIVGASPEMLVKVDRERTVYTHPIAGTRKRGMTEEKDNAMAEELRSDKKELSEHIMLVDLGRNDINRVCDPHTVKVTNFMQVEKYSHVMHLVSEVVGKLRSDQTGFTAFKSIFPAGTVSGAPKIKAIQLIQKLENNVRGVYAGSVGHFDYGGTLDTCISIRTILFKDKVAYLQAGGGIVFDSDPADEYIETVNKLGSNVATIEKAEKYFSGIMNSL